MGKKITDKDYSTKEKCLKEIKRCKYTHIADIKKKDNTLYSAVQRHHWEWYCFFDLRRASFTIKYTRDECRTLSVAYPTEEDLAKDNLELLQYIRQHMWRNYCFAHMKGFDHDAESARMALARFNNMTEVDDAGFGYLYDWIRGQGDVVRAYCIGHFTHKLKYSLEELLEKCSQYKTLRELYDVDKNIYNYVKRYGYEELCFGHFESDEEDAGDGTILVRKNRRDPYCDVPPLDGDCQRLTYRYRIPHREDLDHYMRVANNLYNQCVWEFRHALDDKDEPRWLSYYSLRDRMREVLNLEGECNYRLLPNDHIAERVVQSFSISSQCFASRMRNHKPGQAFPSLPGYRPKGAMYPLRMTRRVDKRSITSDGVLHFAKDIEIPIYGFADYKERLRHFVMATLTPHPNYIEVALAYDSSITPDTDIDETDYAAIDIGLNNLVTMVDQYQTTIYRGGFLKSYHQYYFDQMQRLKAAVQWKQGDAYTHRMQHLHDKRNAYVDDVMNKISRYIVDYLRDRHIGVLIIGWDYDIKQGIHLDFNTRRLFLYGAHGKLIEKLRYKCEAVGIHEVTTEERHTSKCDALALEPIEHHDQYLGRRVKRGLFRSSTGKLINADVNGAINIMRKVIGDAALVRQIINSGHLFCPVGYKHPFGWSSSKQEQAAL